MGEAAASNYYYALREQFERIAERPYLYQLVDFICEGYRRSVYGGHSFYYRIADNTVEIMTIVRSQDTGTALCFPATWNFCISPQKGSIRKGSNGAEEPRKLRK